MPRYTIYSRQTHSPQDEAPLQFMAYAVEESQRKFPTVYAWLDENAIPYHFTVPMNTANHYVFCELVIQEDNDALAFRMRFDFAPDQP